MFVGFGDYGTAASGRDPAKLLQGAKNGALSNTNAHLLSEKSITLGIYPGIELRQTATPCTFPPASICGYNALSVLTAGLSQTVCRVRAFSIHSS